MTDISICCLLYNSETTRAGTLDDFFRHLAEIEKYSDISAEKIVLVDDRTADRSMETARGYCNPRGFHFTDFGDAKNMLLEQAKGDWALIAEPDMRFNAATLGSVLKERKRFKKYKCVEAWQCIHHPDGKIVRNLHYTLINPSLRFEGMVFESLRAYPHETLQLNMCVGDHFVRKYSDRMKDAEPLYKQELKKLALRTKSSNPEELYWAAMRYSELGLMGCLPKKEMDKAVVSLLERAIALKEFGPAYLELAKQHLFMQRNTKALQAAEQGHDKSSYEMCLDFLSQLR